MSRRTHLFVERHFKTFCPSKHHTQRLLPRPFPHTSSLSVHFHYQPAHSISRRHLTLHTMAVSRPKTLNFITGNPNKLSELKSIMQDLEQSGVVTINSSNVEGDEIQGSIEEIARDKASRAAKAVNGPVLTEDTALEFQALKGLPGPYIKYFLCSLGHEGLNNMLAAYEDKTAFAVCTFAYCAGPGEPPILFQGRTKGRIVPARGPGQFGWDPCFEYEGQTYAEMDKNEKNKISHRGKALTKLKAWLAGEEVETS